VLRVSDKRGTVKNVSTAIRLVKSEQGFTLIELVLLIVITGVLAAIAIPKYADLQERATKAEVKALLETGRSAILLDFSDKVLNTGQYLSEPTDASTPGSTFDPSDVTDLENELQTLPHYPPQDRYDHPPNKGFRWYLVTQGSTSPGPSPQSPVIDAIIDITCDVSISAKVKKNDDCFVSKL
jgi:type II secretory pathway pseudopilin PulG